MGETYEGKIIRLSEHLSRCEYCRYGDPDRTSGACLRPGGWRADPRRGYRCGDFERRKSPAEE